MEEQQSQNEQENQVVSDSQQQNEGDSQHSETESSTENKGATSLIARMKQKSQQQQAYGGNFEGKEANMDATACPNCGAGRAKQDGVTKCAYCGFVFIETTLDDGINIVKEDNSK